MIQPFNAATSATISESGGAEISSSREQIAAHGENKQMRDRKCGGLLRKGERKFPDRDDRDVDENGEGTVLEFAREIATDPGIGTEQRQMPFRPAPRDISETRAESRAA